MRASSSTERFWLLAFAEGNYQARADDGLRLVDCMITNAVRCVPPENKPEPAEIASCRPYFESRLDHLPRLKIILALGRIAHEQTLSTLAKRKAHFPFAHGARHDLGEWPRALRQLPLLALQYEHRPADDRHVPIRLRGHQA